MTKPREKKMQEKYRKRSSLVGLWVAIGEVPERKCMPSLDQLHIGLAEHEWASHFMELRKRDWLYNGSTLTDK